MQKENSALEMLGKVKFSSIEGRKLVGVKLKYKNFSWYQNHQLN